MSGSIGLSAISYVLPGEPLDNIAFGISRGFEREFLEHKLGIRNRHKLGDNQNTSDLATEALARLVLESQLQPADIDVLVVVTQTPDYSIPHTSALVQAKSGVRNSCIVFDVSLGCSGFVFGLDLVVAILEKHGLKNGVLITADAYSRIVDEGDRATGPIFGDAATATLVSQDPIYRIGQSVFGSDGEQADSLILRGSGTKIEDFQPLHMNGREILAFTRKRVPSSVLECLALNQVEFDQVDQFVFHQANEFVVRSLGETLGIPSTKLVLEVSETGNTTSSTIPIALARKTLTESPAPERVVLSGFGVGLSWASTLLLKV